jgi:hypothetical protein
MVEARLQEHEKLQYRLSHGVSYRDQLPWFEAEIIGPFDSPFFGRTAFGSDKERAISNLIGQLRRNGFIGRLVEGPVKKSTSADTWNGVYLSDPTGKANNIGRRPHTDLVDHDPLSDDDLLADDYVTGLD